MRARRVVAVVRSAALFRGTERFEVAGELGRGGMGVVYRAFDRERGIDVALKTLPRLSPDGIYRLKRELRALADITHPNLIVFHELHRAGEQWFFTMELLEGCDFVAHIRPVNAALTAATASCVADTAPLPPGTASVVSAPSKRVSPAAEPTRSLRGGSAPVEPSFAPRPPSGSEIPWSVDIERLRGALIQVVHGVRALHATGKIHGDLKPGNVVVTDSGRVVLLDFGLAANVAKDGSVEKSGFVSGTPGYLAPECFEGDLSTASDWYSVGVMLYETLTGWLPHTGSLELLIARKQREIPLPPHLVVDGVSPELSALAMDLLERSPEARPAGAEILRRVRGDAPVSEVWPSSPTPAPVFVGRGQHLRALNEAFELATEGRPVLIQVRGASGNGKTTLVRRFLEDVAEGSDTLVLAGRCYERESVPYKAFDELVDALGSHLHDLPQVESASMLPRDVRLLARVFPALMRVRTVVEAPLRDADDPQELRRRAFAAFKELLGRITDRRPLVLFIDDLQWGDVDSARLLAELLGPPDPPPMLLVASYRSEEVLDSPVLQAMLSATQASAAAVRVREVEVAPLPADEAQRLVGQLLGHPVEAELTETLARESRGNPFLVWELVQSLRAGLSPRGARLEVMLAERVSQLPADAQRLLEIIAVASRPLSQALVARAAALEGDAETAFSYLRTAHFARSRGAQWTDEIEPYHDGIRETLLARLGPEQLTLHHRSIAEALERVADPDPEALALHWEGASETGRAAMYAEAAGARAEQALAFDRAASLYQRAIALRPERAPDGRRQLQSRLGDALTNAGRGQRAAEALLAAAHGASPAQEVDLKRRAAEQLLISGHVEEGKALARWVLESVGLSYPPSPQRAVLSLLAQRARLAVRGLGYREREQRDVPAEELSRIDTCWSLAVGLSLTDLIRGADFSTRFLRLALASGEPRRVARALASEAGHSFAMGAQQRGDDLVRRARSLAERTDDGIALGLCHLVTEIGAFTRGHWRAALEAYEKAIEVLRGRCRGVAWQLSAANAYAAFSLNMLGEVAELSRRVPAWIEEAKTRDDFHAAHMLRVGTPIAVWLAKDDVARARGELRAVSRRLPQGSFQFHHHALSVGGLMTELYAGDGAAAFELITEAWVGHRRALLLHTDYIHCLMLKLRAQSALARGRSGDLRRVARDARRVAGFGTKITSAGPTSELLGAAVASQQGQAEQAVSLLDSALAGFERGEMALLAAATRWRRGELVGGDEGKEEIARADRFMGSQEIVNPRAMTAMLAPGFSD